MPSISLAFVAIFFLALLAGYMVVGRVIYAMPKYHFPALPLACLLAAAFYCRLAGMLQLQFSRRAWVVCALGCAVLAAYAVLVVGDLFLFTGSQLKEAVLTGETERKNAIIACGAGALLFAAPFFLSIPLFLLWRSRTSKTSQPDRARDARACGRGTLGHAAKLLPPSSFALVFLLLYVAGSIGTNIIQFRPGYHTTYGYGLRGLEETADFLACHVPAEKRVIGPSEVVYLRSILISAGSLRADGSRGDAGNASQPGRVTAGAVLPWLDVSNRKDRPPLEELLTDERTGGLVICTASHTMQQIQMVLGSRTVKEILDSAYTERRADSYRFWVRRVEREKTD